MCKYHYKKIEKIIFFKGNRFKNCNTILHIHIPVGLLDARKISLIVTALSFVHVTNVY